MTIEKITRKSHYYNEDRFFIGKNYFMVMDGATPLIKNEISPTEASWFVSIIKKHLPNYTDSVIDELKKISEFASKKLEEFNIPKQNEYLVSAGLAWIEIRENKIFAHTIGDCEVTVRLRNKQISRVYQEQLIKLDSIALQELKEVSKKKNIPIKEAMKDIKQTLIKHRKLMNKINGYSVYTPSSNPDFNYSEMQFNLNEIDEIYIYTDGLSQAFDELEICSYEKLFSNSIDLKNIVNLIEKKALSDRNCEKYPRFKKIDDIAIIKIKF